MTDMEKKSTENSAILGLLPYLKLAVKQGEAGAVAQLEELSKRRDEVGLAALEQHGIALCDLESDRSNLESGIDKLAEAAGRGSNQAILSLLTVAGRKPSDYRSRQARTQWKKADRRLSDWAFWEGIAKRRRSECGLSSCLFVLEKLSNSPELCDRFLSDGSILAFLSRLADKDVDVGGGDGTAEIERVELALLGRVGGLSTVIPGASARLEELSRRPGKVGAMALEAHGRILCNPRYQRVNFETGIQKMKESCARGNDGALDFLVALARSDHGIPHVSSSRARAQLESESRKILDWSFWRPVVEARLKRSDDLSSIGRLLLALADRPFVGRPFSNGFIESIARRETADGTGSGKLRTIRADACLLLGREHAAVPNEKLFAATLFQRGGILGSTECRWALLEQRLEHQADLSSAEAEISRIFRTEGLDEEGVRCRGRVLKRFLEKCRDEIAVDEQILAVSNGDDDFRSSSEFRAAEEHVARVREWIRRYEKKG